MKLVNLDSTTLMDIEALQPAKDRLIIKGTILGSMPITCALTPKEARSLFRLLNLRTVIFLITLLFRR